jgi:hypothetical protein
MHLQPPFLVSSRCRVNRYHGCHSCANPPHLRDLRGEKYFPGWLKNLLTLDHIFSSIHITIDHRFQTPGAQTSKPCQRKTKTRLSASRFKTAEETNFPPPLVWRARKRRAVGARSGVDISREFTVFHAPPARKSHLHIHKGEKTFSGLRLEA